ncbi:MAG: response regulator [Ardenticatenaceae bacterium]|nr:response regulator [Ardenticatenaceae bacterium]
MKNVLIVDDNSQNLYMLQALLEGHGYTVDTAQNGAEALQKAVACPPHFVIADILMPVMDGFALCREWRAEEKFRHIPFLFYTATYTDPKDEAFALSLGADAFLIKPMEPEALLQAIQNTLRQAAAKDTEADSGPSMADEEVYRLYNDRLVKKLEGKMLQLEQEVQERKDAEAALRTSNQLLLQAMEDLKEMQAKHVRQEKLAAIGQLATGMAHDFNNMLSVISLYTELMQRRDNMPPADSKRLDTILHQTRQAANLVQQVLDFSRRTNLDRSVTDLSRTLQDMVALLKRTLSENVRIQLDITPGKYYVDVDRTRIEQVIMNLALNARDAMPEGGSLDIHLSHVSVSPEMRSGDEKLPEGEWAALTIRDQGEGIPDHIRSRLFEPFFTTKPPGRGTGLGLAQVYGIVRQHEGYVDVESEVGKGTEFRIYLPIASSATAEVAQIGQDFILMGQSETILLVEDNEVIREAVLTSLDILNYRPLAAADGYEALSVLGKHPEVSLVLSDVYMPGMNGIELAKALQDTATPIILMTGHTKADLQPLKAQGTIVTWLDKPLSLNLLAQTVSLGLAARGLHA